MNENLIIESTKNRASSASQDNQIQFRMILRGFFVDFGKLEMTESKFELNSMVFFVSVNESDNDSRLNLSTPEERSLHDCVSHFFHTYLYFYRFPSCPALFLIFSKWSFVGSNLIQYFAAHDER